MILLPPLLLVIMELGLAKTVFVLILEITGDLKVGALVLLRIIWGDLLYCIVGVEEEEEESGRAGIGEVLMGEMSRGEVERGESPEKPEKLFPSLVA